MAPQHQPRVSSTQPPPQSPAEAKLLLPHSKVATPADIDQNASWNFFIYYKAVTQIGAVVLQEVVKTTFIGDRSQVDDIGYSKTIINHLQNTSNKKGIPLYDHLPKMYQQQFESSQNLEKIYLTPLYTILQVACGLDDPNNTFWQTSGKPLRESLGQLKNVRNELAHDPQQSMTNQELNIKLVDLRNKYEDMITDLHRHQEADPARKITTTAHVKYLFDNLKEDVAIKKGCTMQTPVTSIQFSAASLLASVALKQTPKEFTQTTESFPQSSTLSSKSPAKPPLVLSHNQTRVPTDIEVDASKNFFTYYKAVSQIGAVVCRELVKITFVGDKLCVASIGYSTTIINHLKDTYNKKGRPLYDTLSLVLREQLESSQNLENLDLSSIFSLIHHACGFDDPNNEFWSTEGKPLRDSLFNIKCIRNDLLHHPQYTMTSQELETKLQDLKNKFADMITILYRHPEADLKFKNPTMVHVTDLFDNLMEQRHMALQTNCKSTQLNTASPPSPAQATLPSPSSQATAPTDIELDASWNYFTYYKAITQIGAVVCREVVKTMFIGDTSRVSDIGYSKTIINYLKKTNTKEHKTLYDELAEEHRRQLESCKDLENLYMSPLFWLMRHTCGLGDPENEFWNTIIGKSLKYSLYDLRNTRNNLAHCSKQSMTKQELTAKLEDLRTKYEDIMTDLVCHPKADPTLKTTTMTLVKDLFDNSGVNSESNQRKFSSLP